APHRRAPAPRHVPATEPEPRPGLFARLKRWFEAPPAEPAAAQQNGAPAAEREPTREPRRSSSERGSRGGRGRDRRPERHGNGRGREEARHEPRGNGERGREEPRREPRRDEPRRDEPRKDEPRRDEPRRMEPQRDSPEPREPREGAPEGPPQGQGDRPARTGRSRRGGRRRRRGGGNRDHGLGGQGVTPGAPDVSSDTQAGFDGDTGQQEMGWTGSPANTTGTHGFGDSPERSAPGASAPAYAPPQHPDEAPARMPEPASGAPGPVADRGSEHAPHAPAPAPEHRPQVGWSAAAPPAGEHGFEGPARDE
ncbi:MAG TPA: hypothetical protein VHN17_13740, partial [Steroidobacteraceae bacterium]|nr:hypothetical protein [Steroidobacteraceae bacterium]